MGVNYGLGGFESQFGFGCINMDKSVSQNITISSANQWVNVVGARLEFATLGNADAGVFSNSYHQVKFAGSGQFSIKTSGVYLITYNVTTSAPSNETIKVRLVKEDSKESVSSIGGLQFGYCRSGDFFEVGSSALAFLSAGELTYMQIANTESSANITLESINFSVAKLFGSGRVNS